MIYKGSCHCGNMAFEVEGELTEAMACNCSICSRKGWLLWFVPGDMFRLLTSEEDICTYTFNKHVIKHQFCKTCGVQPYGEGVDPKGNKMVAVNIRCLEDFDVESVPVQRLHSQMQSFLGRSAVISPVVHSSAWDSSPLLQKLAIGSTESAK